MRLGISGRDIHGDNFLALRDRLLPPRYRAIPTVVRDLESRGLLVLDETVVADAEERRIGDSATALWTSPRLGPGSSRARPWPVLSTSSPMGRRSTIR